MHGMLKVMVNGDTKKRLDIERIRAIKEQTHAFITLHGASGTDDGDMRKVIAAGITVVHINIEVRLAGRNGMNSALLAGRNRPLEASSESRRFHKVTGGGQINIVQQWTALNTATQKLCPRSDRNSSLGRK
jgi:fructose/tagatose bisphosphate aldolase